MKLLTQEKNDVFGREDSVFRISYSGATPDRNSLKEDIAKQLKIKSDSLVIRKIEPKFGKSESLVYVTSYKNKKDLETLELKHLISKNNKEVKKKEEPKEEVVEESKEEKSEEDSTNETKEEIVEESKEEEPSEEKKEAVEESE